jgi:O-antigen/teichoic acid export membrane protein
LNQYKFISPYFKNIFSVALGTIIAQIIPIIFSPILTRIYSPENFGLFGIYMSIVSICVTISSARYDLAIFIPKNTDDAKRVFIITMIINVIFFFISFLILIIFNKSIILFFDLRGLETLILTIPTLVFFISISQNYVLWLNKVKQYSKLNFFKIFTSGLLTSFNLLFGFFKLKYNGLILSVLLTQFVLVVFSFFNIKIFFKFFNINRLKVLLLKYKNFPYFSLPSTLSGEVGAQIPIFLLVFFFNQSIAGYYLLATKIISLPFSVIGNSIATVYRQEAIEEFNRYGKCDKIYVSTLKKVFFISIAPILIIMFGSEWIFSFYFGSEWLVAGKMASYLSVLVFFQLLSSPMADTILFVNGQKLDLFLQLLRLILTFLSFLFGGILNNYELSVILFVASYSIYYILHSIIQFRISKGKKIIFVESI